MKTYKISGLSCQGCVSSLTRAVKRQLGDVQVVVRLESGELELELPHDEAEVRAAVAGAGFSVVDD